MIVLSNEMRTIIDRLLGRTKILMKKIDKIADEKKPRFFEKDE